MAARSNVPDTNDSGTGSLADRANGEAGLASENSKRSPLSNHMLLIVIVALVATTAFYRQAKIAGVHPGKAASVPFVAAGGILTCAYFGTLGIAKMARAINVSTFTVNAVNLMLNAFLLLAYLTVIRLNWKALLQASATDRTDEIKD